MKKYEWESQTMGNIVKNFGEVLKQIWESLTKYHTLDLKWKRIEKSLPTEIWADAFYINNEWLLMDKWDKEMAISDYLSDTYGFCHKGFAYEEADNVIHITHIEWDEEEC
jgi:hypothetical protein